MAAVALEDVSVVLDDVVALDHLDLRVDDGETFGIVGPSGCGKTTVVRVLAGLTEPTTGRVRVGGRDVTTLHPSERDLGLVAQHDTLLRHRTGRRNIRFPLETRRRRHLGRAEERVDAEADRLAIAHLLDDLPHEMSGGQRRAVQLARSLVSRPAALLLDEPLAFIDPQWRHRMRAEIQRVQRELRITMLWVTADQADAMAVSDRLAVLVDGYLHQLGTPRDVYERPATVAVARFFGEPPMNVLAAPVRSQGGERWARVLGHDVRAWSPLVEPYVWGHVDVGVRPEDLAPGPGPEPAIVTAQVLTVAAHGHRSEVEVRAGDERVHVSLAGSPPRVGSTIDLALRPDRFHWFDPATGLALLHPVT